MLLDPGAGPPSGVDGTMVMNGEAEDQSEPPGAGRGYALGLLTLCGGLVHCNPGS